MNKLLLFLLLGLVSFGGNAQEFASKADAHVGAYVSKKKFAGMVLVAKDGKPILRKGYGYANVEWEVPHTPDTRFRIGSITKQFTAMAILQLEEGGKLKTDDAVQKFYADAPQAWDGITIHHLLTHTSGIPSYTSLPNFFRDKARNPMTPAEIVKLTQDKPLEFKPGERFVYNNTGYILLGYIIEKASGEKYADYLAKHIFGPLGMKDSGYDNPIPIIKKRAAGYSADGTNAAYLDMSLPFSAGSLYSTVDDMLIWDKALYDGELLSKESYVKMWTPARNDYAYGWNVSKLNGRAQVSHGGGIHGFNTMFRRFIDDKLTIVVFSNINGPTADRIASDLGKIYFGDAVETPK
jgi:D-alanyl-D-alanine carboxypeptidase